MSVIDEACAVDTSKSMSGVVVCTCGWESGHNALMTDSYEEWEAHKQHTDYMADFVLDTEEES